MLQHKSFNLFPLEKVPEMLYRTIKSLLFKLDPERAHDIVLGSAKILSLPWIHKIVLDQLNVDDKRLEVNVGGVTFSNPVGLAAGFDKSGHGAPLFSALGFGSLELGTVTCLAQAGNDKPRIFRYPKEEALINRMGFPSDGIDALVVQLKKAKQLAGNRALGVNIGKNKLTSIEQANDDYVKLATKLKGLADYVALNISSPNTPDLRKLQEPSRLKELIHSVSEELQGETPIFLKISPDLDQTQLDDIAEVALNSKIKAIIATNTTLSRPKDLFNQTGGLSGKPLKTIALKMVSRLSKLLNDQISIIGVGGIQSGADALDYLKAGASAVQLYTGLVYQGPLLVKQINRQILNELELNNCSSVAELKVKFS